MKEMSMMYKNSLVWVVLIFLSSCAHYKDIPYFQNSEMFDGTGKEFLYDMKIKPKDKLSIFVFSGTDRAAVGIFNTREPQELDIKTRRISMSGGGKTHQYLVDNNGEIEFPILGKIRVADLTLGEVNERIKKLVMPYLQPGTDCVVNTYIENFDVTVMGEVNKPNTFEVTHNKITVLEALAMAGDMTIYGKRDNVKILRQQSDGTYEVHELDMRDANILNSPYYYLEQRDIVYVEPNGAMAQNAKIGRTTQLWVRGASITISLGSLLYRVLQ